jgi:soluble lytic murein transglycosylase-like protein
MAGGGALSRAIAAAALAWATPAAADPVDRWSAEIAEASLRFGIPDAWIRRVMRIETGGEPLLGGRPAVSRAGAMGLMQIMPGTWRDIRALLGLGPDPHNPRDNILAGAFYLRSMYDRFGYPGLFAAYNAGPGRYAAHLVTGRALPAETRAYLLRAQARPRSARALDLRNGATLFAVARAGRDPGPSTGAGALFVQLGGARRP